MSTEQIKPGYKRTEVGVIPEDWAVHRIYDVADNKKARFDDGDWVEAEHITDKGFRLIQTGNIGIGCFVEKDVKKYIYKTSFDKLKCKELVAGDLLICRLADPAGRACLFPELDEEKVITSVDVTIFRPKPEEYDRGYLMQYLSTPEWFISVNEQVGGTTHKRISRGALGKISIPIPASLDEQRAIATALSDVDALLAKLDQLIAKKRGLKQATMQQLLTGQTRLPGFSGEWELKRLGDVADVDPENLSSDFSKKYRFNYISLEDVDFGELKSFSEQIFATAPSRARRRLRVGDVLVSTVRPNLMSHLLFNEVGPDWICSTGFSIVRCQKEKAHSGFIFAHLFGRSIARQIEALVTGSNYPAINSRDVCAFEIAMPSYSEQTAIATILSDMDAELAALEARRDKTRALKQGMMQELLTGRIRLV